MKAYYYLSVFALSFIFLSCSKPSANNPVGPQPTSPTSPTTSTTVTTLLPPTGTLYYEMQTARSINTGEVFSITGENFSNNSSENIIKVNGVQVSHVNVLDGGLSPQGKKLLLLVTCVPKNASSGEVTLTVGTNTVELGMLRINQSKDNDKWSQVADFPGSIDSRRGVRSEAVTLVLNGKAYVGLGKIDSYQQKLDDFWEYDPSSNKWTKKATFPGGDRSRMTAFSIGNKGYVGLGNTSSLIASLEKDFWMYDPLTDKWSKLKDFPAGRRDISYHFTIGNRGYVGFNNTDSGRSIQQLYEYDPSNDSWTERANFPSFEASRSSGRDGITSNLGTSSAGYVIVNGSELWQYQPTSDKWSRLKDIGGDRLTHEFSFVMNDRIWIAYSYVPQNQSDNIEIISLLEYNPLTNMVTEGPFTFPGAKRIAGSAFSIGNQAFAGLGVRSKDLWTFRK